MNIISSSKIAAVALLLSGAAVVSPALAAKVRTNGVAVGGPRTVATKNNLACCHCLGGSPSIDLSTGIGGPWSVSYVNAPTAPAVLASNPAWTQNLAPAKWIGPAGAPTAQTDYTYTVAFNVKDCIIPSTVTLSGQFAADNSASVYLDNSTTPLKSSIGTPNYGFLPGSITPFSTTPVYTGTHTLRFVVHNSGAGTGLVAQVKLTRQCVTNDTKGETR